MFYLHASLCTMCMPAATLDRGTCVRSPGTGVWILGVKLEAFGRAASALNLWVPSPAAPVIHSYFILCKPQHHLFCPVNGHARYKGDCINL